jgi:hypothetical protein
MLSRDELFLHTADRHHVDELETPGNFTDAEWFQLVTASLLSAQQELLISLLVFKPALLVAFLRFCDLFWKFVIKCHSVTDVRVQLFVGVLTVFKHIM